MKKSVIIFILITYILAIVSINFFGLKMKILNPTIYIESITCINQDAILNEDLSYSIIIPYEENLVYPVLYEVSPSNATNKTVRFVYDETKTVASVDEYGRVKFNKKGGITVYVKANDGSSISTKVKITSYVQD